MTSLVSIQNSLSAGELSPNLYGRTDLEKWHSGTATCRNFISDYRGGVMSRPGTAYVGTSRQCGGSSPPRLIPFSFSLTQGYILEFGNNYLSIIYQGAYITETPKTVTGVTKANPAVLTIPSHGFSAGDLIYITGITGMTEFNSLVWFISAVVDTNTIEVSSLFDVLVDSTSFPAYISGGTAARIYTVVSPYAVADLPYLKYTQSADTMTLTCINTVTGTEYPPYDLKRIGQANWTFTEQTFSAGIDPPTGLKITAQSSATASTWYSYVVTSVDSKTGEESIASDPISIQNNDISVNLGSNLISWDAVSGAGSYNVYSSVPAYSNLVPASGLYGFVGTALGPSFVDTNITPDFSAVPPVHNNPFARGVVEDVVPTAAGINYFQTTVGWSVTTSTGTGFDGSPIVANGGLAGFVITNPGTGYVTGDTITFTDSGGGLATGTFTLTSNPSDGDEVFFNGTKFRFKTPPYSGAGAGLIYVEIENTPTLTLQTLANTLNSATNLSVSVAQYSASGTVLTITYKTPGTVGNSYLMGAGTSGGVFSGASLTGGGTHGSGATATLTIGPESGTYPSVATYFQERRVYGNSINDPDTYWMSQPGAFLNFDSSIPVTDSDSITGSPWSLLVNGIQWFVPMPGGLVTLTGQQAWQVNGGQATAITPSNQDAVAQAYQGCNALVPPIAVNYDILYVQSKGNRIRDLSYNFFVNIYTGNDITVMSDHLFDTYQIVEWAWAQEPYKLIWVVRNDGTLLCLTYLKEQEVYSWTRHDTNGQFVSVASCIEPQRNRIATTNSPLVDATYVVVKRYVQGQWNYYVERLDDRVWSNVEEVVAVDAGLSNVLNYPNATLQAASASGTSVVFTASSGVFTAGNVGDVIRIGGGKATVTAYTSSTSVTCNITETITQVIPNDPNNMPIPSPVGYWSISTPVTVLSGLNHLEGMTVTALADGSVVSSQVVTNGQITLQEPASKIVVGLPYTCQLQTLYVDEKIGPQSLQTKRKNISAVGIRVTGTRGIQVGADQVDASTQQNFAPVPWINMTEIKERNNLVQAGTAVPMFTGDYYTAVTSSWSTRGQVAIQQVYPLPATILSVVTYWNTGDDK